MGFFFQEKFDEKKEVVSKLTYQLEAALADARRQAESQREKALAKVRLSSQCICPTSYFILKQFYKIYCNNNLVTTLHGLLLLTN